MAGFERPDQLFCPNLRRSAIQARMVALADSPDTSKILTVTGDFTDVSKVTGCRQCENPYCTKKVQVRISLRPITGWTPDGKKVTVYERFVSGKETYNTGKDKCKVSPKRQK